MSIPTTSRDRIDAALERLARHSSDWVGVGLPERAVLLRACLAGVERLAGDWVRQACLAQRIDPSTQLAGEKWFAGPMVATRALRLMAQAMEQGASPPTAAERQRQGQGQTILTVTPATRLESLVFRGIDAEIWLQPGHDATQGGIYRAKERGEPGRGGVALVLGAGNVSVIAPTDVIHKLFVQDEVVLLKMHPVNEYLGPIFEQAFASLIDAGYLAIVYGGADVGEYCCRHPKVDAVHLTGSHHTHDAIVWGADEAERARRKAAADPVIDKRVSSELGCVTPVIVVPGEWNEADLDYQARNVAGMVTHNASFNCVAAKLLVLSGDWPQREAFLRRLRSALADVPQRYAYYPGAASRYDRFVGTYPQAEPLGPAAREGYLPWTLIPGLQPDTGSYAFDNEAFCGLLAQVDLPGSGSEFLEAATRFVNDEVWGSLSCVLLVDPATELVLGDRLEHAVAALRYGGVAVNAWTAYLFALCTTSWGAFPGNHLDDVGSGIGSVGNYLLLDHPQKSVVRAPFRAWPKPLWFPGHRSLGTLGRRMVGFEASPSWGKLPAVALAAACG